MSHRSVSAVLLAILGMVVAFLASPAYGQVGPDQEVAAPHVTAMYPVGADTLCVVIRHGKVTPGRQEPYQKQPGDQLKPVRHHNWLERDRAIIGTLVGPKHDTLYIPPKFEDQPLDDQWASDAAHYQLVCISQNDPAFAQPHAAQQVHRKARATNLVRTAEQKIEAPREHLIYLTFASPLRAGSTYELRFASRVPAIASATYRHDPRQNRSEAVHVSQIGFRPDDPLKLAFLSLWMGDGGGMKYPANLPFELIRVSDGKTVFTGHAAMGKAADEKEMPGQMNHNGADVWRLGFSQFSEPGEYRVFVESVGCSFPFPIAADAWQKAYYTSVRGLYHQRSGIAMGPPYTDFIRPRPFHPDDGVQVYRSTAAYVEPGKTSAPEDLFARLVKGDTGETTTDAWGGYMDAGDFDRRIEHLVASRCLLDLVTAYPADAKLDLHIPESGNSLPDMIDEALWNLDCYRRMQRPDGSVSAGIESAEHPRVGECSWQESNRILQYAPDPWATAIYAATAAQAARVLQGYDKELARQYRETATKAMEYVEQQAAEGKLAGYDIRVPDARNLAAANLYTLTGDSRWHELFRQTTAFIKPQGRTAKSGQFDQGEAIFAYLQLPSLKTDPTIRKWGMQAVTNEADQLIGFGRETGFGWTGSPAVRIGWGRLTTPRHSLTLIWAYRLTGETKYLEAMIRACQYGAGANPLNLCFTTGVGKQWPVHVFQGDALITNQPVPPGLTPLGPQEWMLCHKWWLNPYMRAYPALKDWPACEAYFDTGMHTITNEPTVHNSITPTFYMWGHLAARGPVADTRPRP